MTEATAAPAEAPKAKKAAAKKATKTATAARKAKVSVVAGKAKKAVAKKQAKADKAIANGRKPKADPQPKTLEGHLLNAKISYGKDADGKAYSQANCPKRSGTGAETEWRKYKDAKMTIQGAMDAGIPRTFVLHDIRHGFVDVAKD